MAVGGSDGEHKRHGVLVPPLRTKPNQCMEEHTHCRATHECTPAQTAVGSPSWVRRSANEGHSKFGISCRGALDRTTRRLLPCESPTPHSGHEVQ